MKSRVHPKYKTKYRVGNWREYERALVQRGDVTLWLSADATGRWCMNRCWPATIPPPRGPSPTDGVRVRPSEVSHLIQDVAHATSASAACPPGLRARRAPPKIDLYRKKAFSARACRWEPVSFFHRRRPIFCTLMMVRSRALDRGRRRDMAAVFVGGMTTVGIVKLRWWLAE